MHYTPDGCRYITGHNGTAQWCGRKEKPGSSYCPDHHALCHIAPGSEEECAARDRIQRLAAAAANIVLRSGTRGFDRWGR